MNEGIDEGTSVQSTMAELQTLADSVNHEDLRRLAKMHELCAMLVVSAESAGLEDVSQLRDQASDLAGVLAAAILGEADNPDDTMRRVRGQVAVLASLAESVSLGEQCEETERCEESDREVAAKLARIFDDEPAAGDDLPVDAAGSPGSDEPAVASGNASADNPACGALCGSQAPPADVGYVSEPLTIKDGELEFVKGFIEEAEEHIVAIEAAVLEVERSPGDSARIDALFRPFHTVKGMAGFLNLRDVNSLTHEVETLLDQGRKGKRPITAGLIDLVFDVVDILKVQVAEIRTYVAEPNGAIVPQPPIADMIGHLRDVVAARIEPCPHQPNPAAVTQKVGEILVEQGAVPQEVVDFAVAKQEDGHTTKKTGEILVGMGVATPKQVSQALRPQATRPAEDSATGRRASVGDQSVRIDTAKLDALVDMVGELVIAQTQVSANPQIESDPRLLKDTGQVTKIVRDVQEVAMAMRMIPIGATFQKMARLVRDVSRKAGKQVELTISGEDTELDKNVIQQIGDPLVHMVRNAVDHGIEAPDARQAVGKPAAGQVHLSAFHHGGNIVIEIRDDGKGLVRDKLIAKAIERGIVQPGEELTDQQAFALIFAPGFSMAAEVTDISGRGVGMDVVKRNIEQLRGKVDIESEVGKGTTFSIRLPLTLAIIDGMVVQVGTERFIIPTINIEQALRPLPEQLTSIQQKGQVLNVRGRLIPLVQLGCLFDLTGWTPPTEAMVVVAHCAGGQIGIVVEGLLGQQQVVIKSLGERFEKLRGVSGAAILGDGKVGLILETSGLALAHKMHSAPECISMGAAGVVKPDLQPRFEDASSGVHASRDESSVLVAS